MITALGSPPRHVPTAAALIQARPLTSQAGVFHGPGSHLFLPGPWPADLARCVPATRVAALCLPLLA
ncbi:MAG: hypothetical protein ACRDRO_25660 [Pseudonocardiaceae bacterium]